MQKRENAGASHGEKRHSFGEAVDGCAPLLIEQKENGGDQRAGVADTDPPDEVDDGEAPADGDVDAPDADALDDQPADGDGIRTPSRLKAIEQTDEPAQRGRPRENDRS